MKKNSKEIAHFQIASELGGLELLDAKYETQNFSRHSHEGYTIGVIEKGAQRFFRTGVTTLRLKTASFLLTQTKCTTAIPPLKVDGSTKPCTQCQSSFKDSVKN